MRYGMPLAELMESMVLGLIFDGMFAAISVAQGVDLPVYGRL